jgi:hypothetical protein
MRFARAARISSVLATSFFSSELVDLTAIMIFLLTPLSDAAKEKSAS